MEPTFRGPLLAASTAVVKEAPLLSLLLASAIPCLQLSNSHASCVTNSLTPTQKKKNNSVGFSFLLKQVLGPSQCHWGYGATAARLTPDQKVGSSNLSGLIFS